MVTDVTGRSRRSDWLINFQRMNQARAARLAVVSFPLLWAMPAPAQPAPGNVLLAFRVQ
jgi:hypothetical protein